MTLAFPEKIVSELHWKFNHCRTDAMVLEFYSKGGARGIRDFITYLYKYEGKCYVNTNIITGRRKYKINEKIEINIDSKYPEYSHFYRDKK